MSRTIRTAGLLSAIIAVTTSPLASAWTPYGGDPQGYPSAGRQDPQSDSPGAEPGSFPAPPGFPPFGRMRKLRR